MKELADNFNNNPSWCSNDDYGKGPGRDANGDWIKKNVDFVQAYIPEIVLG